MIRRAIVENVASGSQKSILEEEVEEIENDW